MNFILFLQGFYEMILPISIQYLYYFYYNNETNYILLFKHIETAMLLFY